MRRMLNQTWQWLASIVTLLLLALPAYAQQQKPSVLYVVSTGGRYCETLTLFSAPGFPKDVDSVKTAEARAGDAGTILEVSEDKKRRWYRIQLKNGKTGWITESCSGSRLQVGGTDPRIFLTLTTVTGKELHGYLRKRSRMESASAYVDLGIVEMDDSLVFQDSELGKVILPWGEIKSILVSDSEAVISTVGGSSYKALGRFGIEKTTRKIETGFQRYRDSDVEISLWLSTKEVDIMLGDLKDIGLKR